MKRTLSLLLALFALLGVLTACTKKPSGPASGTDSTTLSAQQQTFSFMSVVGTESLTLMKQNGDKFQELSYPKDRMDTFDFSYATENLQFVDLNFDGYADITLATNLTAYAVCYFCWLYDVATQKYVYNEQLSALTTISVDVEKKQVISLVHESAAKSEYVIYEWTDGKLTEVKRINANDTTAASEIAAAVSSSTLGTKPSPVVTTKPTTQKKPVTTEKAPVTKPGTDSTTTKKPVTDTTKPSGGGIVLATDPGGWY